MVFLMKLKNVIYAAVMMAVGVFSSCSQQEPIGEPAGETGGESVQIKIRMTSGMLASRTPVIGPDEDEDDRDGKQHVTYVQLLVLKEETDGYTLVYNAPVDWSDNISIDESSGIVLGQRQAEAAHTISGDIFEKGKNYCFLAIGLDASNGYNSAPGDDYSPLYIPSDLAGNSVEAYLFSIYILPWDKIPKLKDDGKINFPYVVGSYFDTEETYNPIARSEFFAGCTYETYPNNSDITVTAERRVAGVKAYLKGIPEKIGEKYVKYVAIGTGHTKDTPTRYNTAIPLLPIDPVDGNYMDYSPNDEGYEYVKGTYPIIAPLPDNAVIDGTPSSRASGGGGTGGDNPDNYPDDELIEVNNGVVTLMGYLPPVVFSSDETGSNSTMMLYLLDESYNVLSSKKIIHLSTENTPLSRAGTGIIDKPVTYPYDSRYHYPIMANHFYRIGSKDNPVNLDASEAEIVVSIDEFQDEYYGGHLDEENPDGVNIDTSWGDHDAGNLDNK